MKILTESSYNARNILDFKQIFKQKNKDNK